MLARLGEARLPPRCDVAHAVLTRHEVGHPTGTAASRFDPAAPLEDLDADYFHLRYRITPDAVIVASTGWGRGCQ